MWDTSREDRLIYKNDLKRLKPGSIIIDISCDPYLEIETSHPTTIDDPVYEVEGIKHYSVDNTPALFYRTVTKYISNALAKHFNCLIKQDKDECIQNAVVIKNGEIIDNRIRDFRKKHCKLE